MGTTTGTNCKTCVFNWDQSGLLTIIVEMACYNNNKTTANEIRITDSSALNCSLQPLKDICISADRFKVQTRVYCCINKVSAEYIPSQ